MTRGTEASVKWSLTAFWELFNDTNWQTCCIFNLLCDLMYCMRFIWLPTCNSNQSCTREKHSEPQQFPRPFHKQICLKVSHPLPLIDVNALICTCYVECEYVLNVAQTVCSWTLTLHKILLFRLLCLENNPARCSLRHVFSSRLSGHRSTLVVTVEMGSVDRRKIRQRGFNCVSSVVLQLLLATLENTGIQSAFRWWRNLFF